MPTIVKCANCGKETRTYPSRVKKYKKICCSMKCCNDYKHRLTGEKSNVWKGDKADYTSKHQDITRKFGKPKKCEVCGTDDPNKKYEWANKDHKYSRNKEDYIRMCVKCHRKYDIENNGYKMFNK